VWLLLGTGYDGFTYTLEKGKRRGKERAPEGVIVLQRRINSWVF